MKFHIFSYSFDSQYDGTTTINEWTVVAMLCNVAMEKVVLIFLHLRWFGLFSYVYISIKSSNAFWSSISKEM